MRFSHVLPFGVLFAALAGSGACSTSSGGSTTPAGGSSSSGGGSSSGSAAPPDIGTLMPTTTDVTPLSWTEQTGTVSNYAPGEAHSSAEATALVDGTADPFYPPDGGAQATAMAVAYYDDSTGTLAVKYILWQMGSATDALNLYNSLPSNSDNLYSNMSLDAGVGDQSRMTPGSYPHMNVLHGAYFLDITDEASSLSDAQMTQFAAIAVGKLP